MQKKLDRYEADPNKLFEEEQTNRIPVEFGTLVRVKTSGDQYDLLIEID